MSFGENLIIEFWGHSGVGKTTITGDLYKSLRKTSKFKVLTYKQISLVGRDYALKHLFIKIVLIILILFRDPVIKLSLPILFSGRKGLKSKIHGLNILLRAVAHYRMVSGYSKSVVILDESLIKGIEAYISYSKIPKHEVVENYIDFMNIAYRGNFLVVLVDSTLKEIINKWGARGACWDRSFFEGSLLGKSNKIKFWRNTRKVTRCIKRVLETKGIPVVLIQNNQKKDIKKAVEQIIKKIDFYYLYDENAQCWVRKRCKTRVDKHR